VDAKAYNFITNRSDKKEIDIINMASKYVCGLYLGHVKNL